MSDEVVIRVENLGKRYIKLRWEISVRPVPYYPHRKKSHCISEIHLAFWLTNVGGENEINSTFVFRAALDPQPLIRRELLGNVLRGPSPGRAKADSFV